MARINAKQIYYAAMKGAKKGMRSAARFARRRKRFRMPRFRRPSNNKTWIWIVGIVGVLAAGYFFLWPKIKGWLNKA